MKTKKAQTMTVEEIGAATTALDNQRGAMHFLLPVSPEARSQTKRLASKAIPVAEKRLQAARAHVDLLPASFDLRQFERDVALMKALEQCRDAAARIHDEVQDTLNEVGTRGWRAGADAFAYIKAAFHGAPGLKRTVGDISGRRAKAASKESAPAKPPATAPPTPPAQTPPAPAPQTPTPDPDKKAA